MNLYYDSNVRILIHKYYLFAFAFSSSRRLSSFNTATASLIVRGRLSYARRWLNRSATEIILLSAALPVLRTAAESGEGSPERRDEGTALHSLRIFLFVVCVGSTSHQQQRGMSSSGCRKLFFPRGIAHAGSSDRLMRGSVRFGSCVTSVKCESDEVFFVSIKTVGRPQTGVKCVSKMSQPRENRARARMCVC